MKVTVTIMVTVTNSESEKTNVPSGAEGGLENVMSVNFKVTAPINGLRVAELTVSVKVALTVTVTMIDGEAGKKHVA